jgi:hypothetical protein
MAVVTTLDIPRLTAGEYGRIIENPLHSTFVPRVGELSALALNAIGGPVNRAKAGHSS